jgi:zinc protease
MQNPTRGVSGLLLAALLVCTSAPATALDDPAARTLVTTLENGLVVLTLEDHTTPVASFQMWVKVGSRDESRYTGLAHLFEHMMFKGSKNVPPEEHARLINARGGRNNAWTSNDFTVYHEDVTAESLPLVIDLEHERVANLDISEDTLTSEREVVLEERRLRTEDTPRGRLYEALFATAYVALPYRHPVIGWRSDVERATVEACQEFFDAYYSPNNIVLSIVGDFDTEETLEHIRRTFGTLSPAESIPRNPTVEPEQTGERRATVHFDLRAPIVALTWHAPPSGHPDGPALDVMGQILSGGRSSRLYRSLVYDKEIAISASGGYWEFNGAGLFLTLSTVRPGGSLSDVEAALMVELAQLEVERVSPRELQKAKTQLEVSLVNGLATNHALASRVGRDFASFGRIRPLEERLDAIRAVTAEDVQRVAREYLKADGRTVVQVVPPAPEEGGGA